VTAVGPANRELDWLVTEFVRGTPGVVHAIVVSGDGLPLAASGGIDATLADQLAAAVSGLASLARGTAHLVRAEPVAQTIVEMNGSYLFVTTVSQGSLLAVLAGQHCDMGMVGYEMTMLASRVGHAITPAPRSWSLR
jgi:predicted regulator of Ras-like GTPase activity (Roadblock/LC7/MglB family)